MSAKLLALCVCPALAVAPLTVPTVRHKAAHHAARVLHRAADRIDKTSAKSEVPCAVPVGAQVLSEPLPTPPLAAEPAAGLTLLETETAGQPAAEPKPDVWETAEYPIEPFYPIIRGGGGGGGGGVDPAPPEPPTPGTVPEPAAWVMLTTGFGLAGYAVRRQQRLAARAAKPQGDSQTRV